MKDVSVVNESVSLVKKNVISSAENVKNWSFKKLKVDNEENCAGKVKKERQFKSNVHVNLKFSTRKKHVIFVKSELSKVQPS